MIIHIFSDSPHHYVPMQAFFLTHIHGHEQHFWVQGDKAEHASKFTYFTTQQQLLEALTKLPQHAQCIFHGLFSPSLIRRLSIHAVMNRSVCVLWGAEIYRYHRSLSWKEKINLLAHSLLLKRCKSVIALNLGDADIAKALFKAKEISVHPYPLINFKDEPVTSATNRILLGNSADPSNRHLDLIDAVKGEAFSNYTFCVPLNYGGSPEYVTQVIEYGKMALGNRFEVITDMLDKADYDALLNQVSCSFFAHQRQQGLYVVYAMLLQGKPMFVERKTTTYQNLSRLGFHLHTIDELKDFNSEDVMALCSDVSESNRSLMKCNFTEQALAPHWQSLIDSTLQ